MPAAVAITAALLMAGAALALTRLVRGRTRTDRAVAANVFVVLVTGGLSLETTRRGTGELLNLLLFLSLFGFATPVLAARFIVERSR